MSTVLVRPDTIAIKVGIYKRKLQYHPADKGKFSGHIPEPSCFVANPNNKSKHLMGEFNALGLSKVAEKEIMTQSAQNI